MELLHSDRIQVQTDLGALAQLLSWFEQFHRADIPETAWLQCRLLLAEAFTNAVRHAHRHQPMETPIQIQVARLTEAVELKVWDQGPTFDLQQTIEHLPTGEDHDAVSGRGLKLIRKMATSIRYEQTDDQRNCLVILKLLADC